MSYRRRPRVTEEWLRDDHAERATPQSQPTPATTFDSPWRYRCPTTGNDVRPVWIDAAVLLDNGVYARWWGCPECDRNGYTVWDDPEFNPREACPHASLLRYDEAAGAWVPIGGRR